MSTPKDITSPNWHFPQLSVRQSFILVFIVSLLIIGFAKYGQWREPPYWDAAFSVFPAAITLAETGFDYPSLLSAPAYMEGGPNVHATSLITLTTAVVYSLSGSPSEAYLILHWIHYAIAATTIALFYLWCMPVLGKVQSLLAAMAMLLCPLLMTQAGHMYLELPAACAALLALLAYDARKIITASGFAFLAVLIKEPGLIVTGALVLLCAFDRLPIGERIKRIAIIALPTMILTVGQFVLHKSSEAADISFAIILNGAFRSLASAPDLLIIAIAALLAVVFQGIRVLRPCDRTRDSVVEQRLLASAILVVVFLAFYLALASLGWIVMLMRYFVIVLPFMILLGCDLSCRVVGMRLTASILGVYSLISIINYNGRFYPYASGNDGSVAERSNEYVDLLKVHQDSMAAAQKIPVEIPVIYGLPQHYFTQYPSMSYVSAPLRNGHCILHKSRYLHGNLEDFPDHFYIIYSFRSLGGEKLNWLRTQALADTNYSVSTSVVRHGHYQAQLVEIRRIQESSQDLKSDVH